MLLDPWFFPLEGRMKGASVDLPVLILRTPGFDLLLPEIFKNKERAINFLLENNKECLRHSLCCYLKESTHVS